MGERKVARLECGRQTAAKYVERVARPAGIQQAQWRGVQATLAAVAKYYPKACPSQARLAQRVGASTRSVQRYVAMAIRHGLLEAVPDGGVQGRNRWSKTNRYHLLVPSGGGGSAPGGSPQRRKDMTTVCRTKIHTSGTSGTSGTDTPSESSTLKSFPPKRRGQDPRRGWSQSQKHRKGTRMREWTEPERETAPPLSPASSKNHHSTRAQDLISTRTTRLTRRAAQNLVVHFQHQWRAMLERKQGDQYADQRVLESDAEMWSYIRKHFTGQYTTEQVRRFIEQFMEDVLATRVRIKPEQSVWRCFTGAWGRNKPTFEDRTAGEFDYSAYQRIKNGSK